MRSAPPAVVLGRAPLRHPAEWMTVGVPETRLVWAWTSMRPLGPLRLRPVPRESVSAPVIRRRREARPVSAATTRSRTPDRLCAEAVDLARAAAEEAAAPGVVGEHVSLVSEGDRVVTHFFECKEFGYRGWRWAVTVARASRAKVVTLDETVLLPGPDALLAPEWVPWSERLRPGDMGPGDLLPTEADDLRLEPGFSGEDAPPPNSAVSEEMAELVEAEDAEVTAGPCGLAAAGSLPRLDLRARRGARHAPGQSAVPVRAPYRRGPLGRVLRREDPDGTGGPRGVRDMRLPGPHRGLAAAGLRRVRERVLMRRTGGSSPWRTAAEGTPRRP